MPNRREFDHIGTYNFKVEIEGVAWMERLFWRELSPPRR